MSTGDVKYYGNVLFLGVGRVAGQGIVVASNVYRSQVDMDGVRQVLEQPNMSMEPGKHYSFESGEQAWHLINDESGLIYITICITEYPQRCAHMCLEELQRSFSASYGEKARTAKDGALDKAASKLLLKLCQKYDDVNSIDKLAATFAKVQSVKLVMQENVDLALQNCVKLESIERAAEDLQQQAGFFKRDARELRKRMWWKNCKWKLMVAAVVLIILGAIVGIIFYIVDQNKKVMGSYFALTSFGFMIYSLPLQF